MQNVELNVLQIIHSVCDGCLLMR